MFTKEVMALYTQLPIYHDAYKLLLDTYKIVKTFPREYKYTLGERMKELCLELVLDIYRANSLKERIVYLQSCKQHYEGILICNRICKDLQLVGIKQIAKRAAILDSLGRQLTGWIKSTK